MTLSSFFQISSSTTSTHRSVLMEHDDKVGIIDDIAKMLAFAIVDFRCRSLEPRFFNAWKNRVENNSPLSKEEKVILRGMLDLTFGEPNEKFTTQGKIDHLEGFVGEWLWYFLMVENTILDIERVEPPGIKSTDPGGDALVIHKLSTGDLVFRLWEMKKFAPKKPGQKINSTITRACNQLNTNAVEYLARYTGIGQELSDPELKQFYSQLMLKWANSDPDASVGVSIATSNSCLDINCFDNLGDRFPKISNGLIEGVLTGLTDFSAFAEKVQEFVWKGL